jgi:hypothetical protein
MTTTWTWTSSSRGREGGREGGRVVSREGGVLWSGVDPRTSGYPALSKPVSSPSSLSMCGLGAWVCVCGPGGLCVWTGRAFE